MALTPQNRQEEWLNVMSGGKASTPLTPLNRLEEWYQAIIDAQQGGGGGGDSQIPDYSSADDGKLLGVDGDSLSWVSMPTETWTFELEDGSNITKNVVVVQ